MDITRFQRTTVHFTSEVSVEGYKSLDGEYRVSLSSASEAVGYEKTWVSQMVRKQTKTLKALQGLGFTGGIEEGQIAERSSGISGASVVKTISLDDFSFLIIYAAAKGKPPAIALNRALVKMSLYDFFCNAFGDRLLTFEEKLEIFYKAYAETIDWLADDRLEIEALALPGDPPEIINWNASFLILDDN